MLAARSNKSRTACSDAPMYLFNSSGPLTLSSASRSAPPRREPSASCRTRSVHTVGRQCASESGTDQIAACAGSATRACDAACASPRANRRRRATTTCRCCHPSYYQQHSFRSPTQSVSRANRSCRQCDAERARDAQPSRAAAVQFHRPPAPQRANCRATGGVLPHRARSLATQCAGDQRERIGARRVVQARQIDRTQRRHACKHIVVHQFTVTRARDQHH
jgi:hypothetical protein